MLRRFFLYELFGYKTFCIISLHNYTKNLCYANMPKPGYYAVRIGKKPGIYTSWTECEFQVKGFPNAVYKKFPTLNLAQKFLNDGSSTPSPQINNGTTNSKKDDSFSPNTIDSIFADCSFDEELPRLTSLSNISDDTPKIICPKPSKKAYYAVHRGKKPGVYRTWTECSFQIQDIRNASYRKFDNEADALEYVRTGGIIKANKRELNFLEIKNKVIKKRKLNDGSSSINYVLENPNEPVLIFTDGASTENGKKRSRAGIGVYWGDNHPLNTSKRITGRQTNNRAEIYAAVHALNQAKQIGAKKVKLYTDSQFVIHAITDWIKKWKANGWKLVTGKEVVNKEDFIALDVAQTGLDVEWIYVKAHARNKGNDEADKLAVAGSRLLLQPSNYSEFQNVHVNTIGSEEIINDTFFLTKVSDTPEKILPLIVPDIKEKKSFYAVHKGKCPGVYKTWTECEEQIKDFPNPSFKKFCSEAAAKEFVNSGNIVQKQFLLPKCNEDEFVTVFTDGACSSNGKEGSCAGIGVYWGPGNPLNTSMRLPGRQTNNRAEIYAAVHALKQAKNLGIKNIRLFTDSQFVIKGITTWIKKWKENDWKLANGKAVVNKEDFIALDEACQGLNIEWCYIKAHDNNPGNVEADQLAVAGCNKSLSDTIMLA